MSSFSVDLFSAHTQKHTTKYLPLAERIRPRTLEEFVGQEHLLGDGKALRRMIEQDEISSLLLWGPPGSGKTTLARIVANYTQSHFVPFSAVMSGVPELRKVVKDAQAQWELYGKKTILFVDEIHRLNKTQQDAFLPHVEDGTVILVGATTNNPSYEVNRALLSRCQVFILQRLKLEDIAKLLQRTAKDAERGLGNLALEIQTDVFTLLANHADGDTRIALNLLETVVMNTTIAADGCRKISQDSVRDLLGEKTLAYDKYGEEHYNVISAFIKSLRGSDPDASIYYLARMLDAGEDPKFIARRMIILASEDIGNADPQALLIAVAAMQAVTFIGLPEAQLNLSQAAVYLALAPKNNAEYKAILAAKKDVKTFGALAVPLHLRNAPSHLMKEVENGKEYRYPHDYEGNWVEQDYLPEALKGKRYYHGIEDD
ncbi:AAA family ATPase [candidate division KSB3 bacterium]|uniref:AAA family ATPase n=1 Tax=candidate division KSB3 bacterium TaxID=2044937 RepID=A0A2G6EED5_9BACT|nr:MAG: AAA family ATPase [candidate division KSB3 bacterium]PIE31060.1 MAG: AAA family ATPase [candidate division KSB3 bacterium]